MIKAFSAAVIGLCLCGLAFADDALFDCDPELDGVSNEIRCVAAFYPLVSFVDPEPLRGSNFERHQQFRPILGGLWDEKPKLATKLSPI